MNIQKKFAQIGVILIVFSGAIIYYLTIDFASNISDIPKSGISFFQQRLSNNNSNQINNEISEMDPPQLNFADFKAIDPESAAPALALFQESSKSGSLSLRLIGESTKLSALYRITIGENSNDTPVPAKNSDLSFDGHHQLVSEPISPENLLGKRTSFILLFSKDSEPSAHEIEEPFGWGDCNDNRVFVHVSRMGLNFHYGVPEERLDVSVTGEQLIGKKQLLILDIKSNGTEVEKNLYLNTMHLGKVLNKDSKAGFSTEYPLILGNSECKHPFRGQIHKFYIFKDLSDKKLMGIAKFLYSSSKN